MTNKIFHVVLPEIWEKVKDKETYEADSLESEGFIHCSYAAQLEGVLERYYSGADRVMVLEIDPDRLSETLKIELSTNDELYPHIYGGINLDAVISVTEKIVSG